MSAPSVALLIPDSHIPNEHKNYDLMLRAARKLCPDTVVILGDYADCESLSSHEPTHTRGRRDFLEEVRAVRMRLRQLSGLVGVQNLHYVMGNHEWRLERYLAKNAPALSNIVSVDAMFALKENGWKVTEYRETLRIGKLNITHDTGSAGTNAHRTAATDYMGNAIIGHTHRMAYEVKGRPGAEPTLAAMFGWLGDPKKVDYLHQVKASHWVHGFGVAYFDKSGIAHVQPVPIINGTCCIQGQFIK
jgi:predicted phosphodiesterase